MKKKRNPKNFPAFAAKLTMAGTSATLDVSGTIGWDTEAMAFNDKVAQAKQAGCTSLTVRINSLGGYCYDGLAMGDCLESCGMETTGVVVGTAQSMASYLLQCCKNRVAHPNATLMFHQPSAGVWGTVDEITEQARALTQMRDTMFAKMAARCGTTGPELSQEHMTMKIYTAAEALAKGFLDSIEEGDAPAQDPGTVDASAHTASGAMLYDHPRMLMAMLAESEEEEDDPKEPTQEGEEGEEEDEPKEPTQEGEEGEEEDEPKEPTQEGEEGGEEDEPKEPEEEPGAKASGLTMDQVQQMISDNNARLLASMGVPPGALPSLCSGTPSPASTAKKPTMQELDRMPAHRRMILLQQDPDLAREYLTH